MAPPAKVFLKIYYNFIKTYKNWNFYFLFLVSLLIELGICTLSMRGSILNPGPREFMKYWLYARFCEYQSYYPYEVLLMFFFLFQFQL